MEKHVGTMPRIRTSRIDKKTTSCPQMTLSMPVPQPRRPNIFSLRQEKSTLTKIRTSCVGMPAKNLTAPRRPFHKSRAVFCPGHPDNYLPPPIGLLKSLVNRATCSMSSDC